MTTPHPAPAEKLTAGGARAPLPWTESNEAKVRASLSHRADASWSENVVAGLVQWLDASRAETEAVRRVLDAAEVLERPTLAERVGCLVAARDTLEGDANALRSLAAELVEGLEGVREHMDGHLDSDCRECAEWKGGLDGVLTRARAQGIGGEKEKGNG